MVILSLTLVACWGDAIYTVRVLNLTDQDLTIYVTVHPAGHTLRIGSIKPGKEIKYEEIYYDKYYY